MKGKITSMYFVLYKVFVLPPLFIGLFGIHTHIKTCKHNREKLFSFGVNGENV